MSEIIGATAQQVLEGLASAEGQAAGESVADWLARSQFERVVSESSQAANNYPVYKWNYDAAEAFDEAVNASNAQQAFEDWWNAGGNKSTQGAASQPSVKAANPNTAMKKAGASTASVGGLLSMSLPTWTAAAAPLLGVALGVGLYESNPELWTKISQRLLPFCYPDSEVMPVVTDEDGNTYIDKEAVEALKDVLDEEGIGGNQGHTDPLLPYVVETAPPFSNLRVTNNNTFTCNYPLVGRLPKGSYGYAVAFSTEQATTPVLTYNGGNVSIATFGNQYTYQNKTVYYTRINIALKDTSWGTQEITQSDAGKAAWIAAYGEPTGDYQEGTQRWGGVMVDIAQLPINEVYTDPTGANTRDFIPVALPTEPGTSLDPEENPDPTQNEDPEKQIDPYILPTDPADDFPEDSKTDDELTDVAPIPMPFPDTDPDTKPEANPTEPDEQPPQKLVDVIPPIDYSDLTFPSNPLPGDPDNIDGGVGGLVSVYNPTYSELQAFSQWLWVTYADATIDKIWNNPFDGVISLHELYATPNKGQRKYIKSGFLVSPVNSITIPNRYSEINCGSAVFPEFYGNYLDYSPYTKALCYLPFIGIVELNPDDIIGHAVNIRYRVDSYSGACIALLECAREGSNAVLYQFSGNCSVQMPIAGGTQASIKAAQISAGAYQNAYHVAGLAGMAGGILGGIGSLLSGNIGGAISNAVHGLGSYATNQAFGQANAVSQTVSAKSSVQHSGQFGESFGAMGAKKPYMIIKRPVQVIVNNYQDEYGYQAHKYVTIGECTGYLRCRGVHFASARATDDEKQAVERALMEGVLVT